MTVLVSAILALTPIAPTTHNDRSDQISRAVDSRQEAVSIVNYVTAAQRWEAMLAATPRAKPRTVHTNAPTQSVAAPSGGVSSVMQCIKDHESGIYTRNNHGYSGASGAYQIIRSTWKAWAPRAGVGADAAYLASPAQQDAVVSYMLANGGAGNWSPRYGADPCTVGMGG